MSRYRNSFDALVKKNGSPVHFHRDDSTIECPCRTPEGYRDLSWHRLNPEAPLCNERGFLPSGVVDIEIKGFVQPIQSSRATRLQTEILEVMFGDIQTDDHLGIFPLSWNGQELNFADWGKSGEDYLIYDSKVFTVVNVNRFPGPDGEMHHTECALRLIR